MIANRQTGHARPMRTASSALLSRPQIAPPRVVPSHSQSRRPPPEAALVPRGRMFANRQTGHALHPVRVPILMLTGLSTQLIFAPVRATALTPRLLLLRAVVHALQPNVVLIR